MVWKLGLQAGSFCELGASAKGSFAPKISQPLLVDAPAGVVSPAAVCCLRQCLVTGSTCCLRSDPVLGLLRMYKEYQSTRRNINLPNSINYPLRWPGLRWIYEIVWSFIWSCYQFSIKDCLLRALEFRKSLGIVFVLNCDDLQFWPKNCISNRRLICDRERSFNITSSR